MRTCMNDYMVYHPELCGSITIVYLLLARGYTTRMTSDAPYGIKWYQGYSLCDHGG